MVDGDWVGQDGEHGVDHAEAGAQDRHEADVGGRYGGCVIFES